jgi:anti-anti-sigma regulatory factor
MNLARLSHERRGRALVVRIEGEIDLSNVDPIRLDSSGIRLLFDLAQRLHTRRQQLVLVVTDEALVRRVILLTKLDDAVPLHETLDDALAALNGA